MAGGRTLRLLGCLGLATVLAVGCSSTPQASTSLPSTSSAKPSSTLPPLGPPDFPVPAAAREQSRAGALAFTHYYMDLTNHQTATLDSKPLRDLSRGCKTCDDLARSYDEDRTAGYHYQGGQVSITSTGSVVLNGTRAELSFALEQTAMTVFDAAGAVVSGKSSPAYQLSGGIALTWDAMRSTWIVVQLDAESV